MHPDYDYASESPSLFFARGGDSLSFCESSSLSSRGTPKSQFEAYFDSFDASRRKKWPTMSIKMSVSMSMSMWIVDVDVDNDVDVDFDVDVNVDQRV